MTAFNAVEGSACADLVVIKTATFAAIPGTVQIRQDGAGHGPPSWGDDLHWEQGKIGVALLPLNDAANPSISTLSPADATALQNAILQAENAIKQAGSVQSLLNSAAVLVGTAQQSKGASAARQSIWSGGRCPLRSRRSSTSPTLNGGLSKIGAVLRSS
jgi:hypothetical protein